jgi:DNA-binding Xre family transcriptional regulator
MADRKTFNQMRNELLADPATRESVEREASMLIAMSRLLNQIDQLREAKDWTKADLARAAGMHPSNLRKMLSSGEKNIELETLIKLLYALDVEIKLSPRKVKADSVKS